VDGPAELRDLADSFNGMLVRLRQIEGERRVLLGGLPHDLRAPLTRLRLRIETLTGIEEQPGIIEDIAAIDRIVRQFTEYLRGVQPDEPRAPLEDIVRGAVDAYRSIGIDVRAGHIDVQASLPRFAMRRLIDNLIDNAVQHGRAPVLVSIAATPAGMVEVSVTDHGDGMAADLAETALEPFTKLDPARGRGGCGLGLAIVRQLARQLGGGVRFEKRTESFSVVASLGVD
jgi:two-component system osmolarity sensor histidine kinase EnvZ